MERAVKVFEVYFHQGYNRNKDVSGLLINVLHPGGGFQKMNLEEIENAALKLNPNLRAKLAEKLLHSLESLTEAENERIWAEECLRRNEELEKGTAVERSGEDVLRDAKARLL
jgi:hypothetical protein